MIRRFKILTASLRMDFRVWREKLQLKTAWAMPHWLVYWVAIRRVADGSNSPKYRRTDAGKLRALDMLKSWESSE